MLCVARTFLPKSFGAIRRLAVNICLAKVTINPFGRFFKRITNYELRITNYSFLKAYSVIHSQELRTLRGTVLLRTRDSELRTLLKSYQSGAVAEFFFFGIFEIFQARGTAQDFLDFFAQYAIAGTVNEHDLVHVGGHSPVQRILKLF